MSTSRSSISNGVIWLVIVIKEGRDRKAKEKEREKEKNLFSFSESGDTPRARLFSLDHVSYAHDTAVEMYLVIII